ncbi:carboxypeptidase B-like [Sycon ciliatum]|uniref:carboxypeptidase B-like n=1 Tax=Sycon ciliatum TaxID=27933 RepID=UPI0020A91A87|eukprot:scpid63592/ scgid15063/ Carboxypeptidase B
MKATLLVLCGLLACSWAKTVPVRTVTYDGDRVFRCNSKEMSKTELAKIFTHDAADMWAERADGTFDVRTLSQQERGADLEAILHSTAACNMVIANVEDYIASFEASARVAAEKVNSPAAWHDDYHTYAEIYAWYQELALEHPDVLHFESTIGESGEGRLQPAVHIAGGSRTNSSRHRIYFQCQIHAREWISGATCMYIVDYLVNSYHTDTRVRELLDTIEFVVVPFTNPDGYTYTWNGDRLWRKNRRINAGSTCRGVDQNRNYNSHWNEGGSSSNPCSETYHGPGPASEPETQNTQNYFRENFPIVGAIDWHSYSQLILRPWGYTSQDSPDESRLSSLGSTMRSLILSVHGMSYTSQKSIGLYPTSGTASDWFYDYEANEGNPFRAAGYTVELRDTGRYGFLLPPTEIIPTGQEMIPAVLEFAESLTRDPLTN